MSNHHLRGIILKLQDRLSNEDRKRLHFFLGNDVPRPIRDDSTLSGTLSLMESLFDQDKISDENFTFLINAFDEIQCFDAAQLLRGHMRRLQSNLIHQSTHSLTTIMPSLLDEILTDLDTYRISLADSTLVPLMPEDEFDQGQTMNGRKGQPLRPDKDQPSCIPFGMNTYFFIIFFLVLIVFAVLIGLAIMRIQAGVRQTDDNNLLKEQRTINDQLQNQLRLLTTEENNPLIKPGQKFGKTGGEYFDDSLPPHFTCAYHLSGIYARDNNDGLESYQFSYSSSSSTDDQNPLKSLTHGNQTSAFKKEFLFPTNEKINRIKGRIVHKNILSPNGTNLTMSIVTGLRFFSTRGGASPPYEGELGEMFREEFDGYTLGYVTGRSGQYIEQLQFFWYRTKNIE